MIYSLRFMSEVANEFPAEFAFTSELPKRKTKETFIQGVKRFFKETDGGAIPVSLACKILKCSDVTLYRWIEKGKIRGHKFNKTVLVSVADVEAMLDMPRDKGGRPKKETA